MSPPLQQYPIFDMRWRSAVTKSNGSTRAMPEQNFSRSFSADPADLIGRASRRSASRARSQPAVATWLGSLLARRKRLRLRGAPSEAQLAVGVDALALHQPRGLVLAGRVHVVWDDYAEETGVV